MEEIKLPENQDAKEEKLSEAQMLFKKSWRSNSLFQKKQKRRKSGENSCSPMKGWVRFTILSVITRKRKSAL